MSRIDRVKKFMKFDPVVKPINIEMKELGKMNKIIKTDKPKISKVEFDEIPPDKEMRQLRDHLLATFPTGEIHK